MMRAPALGLLKRAVTAARPRPDLFKSIRPYSVLAGGGGDESKKGTADKLSHAEAKNLLRLENVEALKERLNMEDKEVIQYGELLKACQSIGVATSADEAAAFARILDDAGVVMLFRDKVYLHPDKVVDLVRRAVPLALLPDDPRRDELQKLQEKKEEIDVVAHKQVRRILWAGLRGAVLPADVLGVLMGCDGAHRLLHHHGRDPGGLRLLPLHVAGPDLSRPPQAPLHLPPTQAHQKAQFRRRQACGAAEAVQARPRNHAHRSRDG